MSRFRIQLPIAVASLLAGIAVCCGFEPARDGVVPTSFPAQAKLNPSQSFIGTSSCTASSCHGGNPATQITGSEHTVWLQDDMHANAFNVLFNETSQRMAKLLNLEKPAHESPLCLNCHGPVADAPFPTSLSAQHASIAIDGVSCEACHGAASKWLGPHVRADWKAKSVEQKAEFGFRDTKDFWQRAKLCADCHVGAAGRDVNHDLYAAGHPRLFFELSAFQAMMPSHWDKHADRARAAGVGQVSKGAVVERSPLDAQLWAIGQVASAEAALDLLIHRAKTSDAVIDRASETYPSGHAVASWPELAETACFACHHDLASPSWRQARGYSHRKPGAYPWGTWLFPLVPQASSLSSNRISSSDGPLAALSTEMSKPLPGRKAVIGHAEALQTRLNMLGQELNTKSLSVDAVSGMFVKVATDGAALSNQSWDEATQVYLGLVALNRAHQDLNGKTGSASDTAILSLRDVLKFEPGYDSPLKYLKQPDTNLEDKLKQIRLGFEGQ